MTVFITAWAVELARRNIQRGFEVPPARMCMANGGMDSSRPNYSRWRYIRAKFPFVFVGTSPFANLGVVFVCTLCTAFVQLSCVNCWCRVLHGSARGSSFPSSTQQTQSTFGSSYSLSSTSYILHKTVLLLLAPWITSTIANMIKHQFQHLNISARACSRNPVVLVCNYWSQHQSVQSGLSATAVAPQIQSSILLIEIYQCYGAIIT